MLKGESVSEGWSDHRFLHNYLRGGSRLSEIGQQFAWQLGPLDLRHLRRFGDLLPTPEYLDSVFSGQ